MPSIEKAILHPHNALTVTEALLVAVCGMLVVFMMLAVIALLVPSSLAGLATIGVAVVLHESSTLVVVLNALRLLGYKGPRNMQDTLAAA